MKKSLFTTFLVVVSFWLNAQKKYYFTSFWRLTNGQEAVFYRVATIDQKSQRFVGEFADYTIQGTKIQEGFYSPEGSKNGSFKRYYFSGELHSEGNYKTNQMAGE